MSLNEDKIWYIECGAQANGYFTRNHIMTMDQVNAFRFKYTNTGVFSTAYIYDDMNQKEANLLGDFYLDLDGDLNGDNPEAGFNLIREDALSCISYLRFVFGIPEEYINIYFSGNKGLHITVPYQVFDIKPNKALNVIYRSMAEEISKNTKHQTVDLKIYDNKRLFRMINSRHQKSGLYKIRLTHEEVKQHTLAEIQSSARMPRPNSKVLASSIAQARSQFNVYEKKLDTKILKRAVMASKGLKPLELTPPCIDYILKNKVAEGQRNCTVAVLTSFFHQQNMNIDEARDRLEEWNYEQCSPPMDSNEIEITLNSVYNGGYSYGCSSAKILSVCDNSKCPLGKRKRK
jgi:hypothetical protein